MTKSLLERPAKPDVGGTQNTDNRKSRYARRRLLFIGGIASIALVAQATICKLGQAPKSESSIAATTAIQPITLAYPLNELKKKIAAVASIKDLRAGVFAVDLKTGKYLDYNGHDEFAAASMIKVPILVALLQALDSGQVKQDQLVEIRQDLVTGGSGWLQWRPVGSKVPLRDVSDWMITISDNTATNMIIDLLGGKEKLNRQFLDWGLTRTRINNMLGDFEGTNKTSPYDMVFLLARIERGELISADSRDLMYKTMERTRIRTLLPPGLEPGAKIAHKTGDIGTMVGDAGIVTTPAGQRFLVSVQVERPHNDRRANLLIRSLSKMLYKCFSTASLTCDDVAAVPLESLASPAHHISSKHHRRHQTKK